MKRLERYARARSWRSSVIARRHLPCYQFLGDLARRKADWTRRCRITTHSLELVREHIGYLPEVQRRIAQLLLMGACSAAAELAEEAARLTGKDDLATVASTGMVMGRVREAQGRFDEAESSPARRSRSLTGHRLQPVESWRWPSSAPRPNRDAAERGMRAARGGTPDLR